MSEKALHDEALRKTRVLQRKKEAMERIGSQGDNFESYKMYQADPRRGGGSCNDAQAMDEESVRRLRVGMQKDLKQRAKVLRDHNLYMGPMSAYQDILPPSSNSRQTKNVK